VADPFRRAVAIELAKRDLLQRDLADLLKVAPTTLSDGGPTYRVMSAGVTTTGTPVLRLKAVVNG